MPMQHDFMKQLFSVSCNSNVELIITKINVHVNNLILNKSSYMIFTRLFILNYIFVPNIYIFVVLNSGVIKIKTTHILMTYHKKNWSFSL